MRCSCVLRVLEKLVNEVSAVRVEILKDVEIDLALVGIESLDKLTASFDQGLKGGRACCVLRINRCTRIRLPMFYDVAYLPTRPSRVELPLIWSSGMSR